MSDVYSVEPVEVQLWVDGEMTPVMGNEHDENFFLKSTNDARPFDHWFMYFNNMRDDYLWKYLGDNNKVEDHE